MANLRKPIHSSALLVAAAALSITLMGAASGDSANVADTAFTQQSMQLLLQGVSNANVAEKDGDDGQKTLATSIQNDEVKIGDELASLASYYGISCSTDDPKATTDASSYDGDQVQSLTKLIALFQDEQNNGGGAQLRSFATESIPTLQKDLAAAQQANH
jgi:hypothetical protein